MARGFPNPPWYTCPECDGRGSFKVKEGSGFRLVADPRCGSSGIVTDVVESDPRGKPSPPYHKDLDT